MLRPVGRKSCFSATIRRPCAPPRMRPAVAARRLPASPPLVMASGGSIVRSVHGFIFSPVMHGAASICDWQLTRDGFVARDVATPTGNVRVWDAPGSGSGPCAVLLHGLGGSSGEYRAFLQWLQTQCRRVISVDMPGHGVSHPVGEAAASSTKRLHHCVERFTRSTHIALDAVLNEPCNIVGHSLGGYVAMRYALEGAGRRFVLGLVPVSPDGAPWTEQERIDDRALFEVDTYAQAVDIAMRTYPLHPIRASFYAPFIWARFATPAMRYLNRSDAKQPVLAPQALAALPGRILLVFGKQERFDPPHNITYFCTHMPRTMRLAQPNTGHGDIVDAHPELLAVMQDFLA